MYYVFIADDKRCLYDLKSGCVCEITRIEKEMLPYLQRMEKPLSSVCPTTLRYALAKYESSNVSNAYTNLLTLVNEGKLSLEKDKAIVDTAYIDLDSTNIACARHAAGAVINNVPTVEKFVIRSSDAEKATQLEEMIKNDFSFIDVEIA